MTVQGNIQKKIFLFGPQLTEMRVCSHMGTTGGPAANTQTIVICIEQFDLVSGHDMGCNRKRSALDFVLSQRRVN